EHPEVVGLTPDDLLLAGADAQRDVPELEIDVRLAQLVLELVVVALVLREAVELEEVAVEPLVAQVRLQVLTAVRLPVDVELGREAGRRGVDAVVHAAPLDEELRA